MRSVPKWRKRIKKYWPTANNSQFAVGCRMITLSDPWFSAHDKNNMTKPQSGNSRASGRITLAMVAERAGVATMTASRAITQPDMVSQALLDRVEQAVAELGYVPN